MQVFKQHGLKVFENKVLRETCVTDGTGAQGGAQVQQHSI